MINLARNIYVYKYMCVWGVCGWVGWVGVSVLISFRKKLECFLSTINFVRTEIQKRLKCKKL
jgi:hypothetical protein